MALTVQIKSAIEIVEKDISSHQGTSATSVDTPIEVLTQTNAAAQYCVAFSASTALEIWDDSDAHGIDELTMLWVKSTQDGMLEFQTSGEAANDDVNSISLRANIPMVFFATSVANKLQAYDDITGVDALGTGTLDDVTKVRFLDVSGNTGEIEVIIAK